MSIKFLESSVYRSDRDLTGEEHIADINKNWYIHGGRYSSRRNRISVICWSYIGQLSVICRSTVGGISVNCRLHIGQLLVAYQSCVNMNDILRAKRNVFQVMGSPIVIWLIVSSIGQVLLK